MILKELDRPSVHSCMLTCPQWHVICERIVYRSPRLSSVAALAAFLQSLYDNPNLGRLVRRLHIRRQADRAAHTWSLAASGERHVDLALILPNARSLTFENLESVFFWSAVCGQLKQLKEVAELDIRQCQLFSSHDFWDMIFAFPALSTLALSHVEERRWIMQQGTSMPCKTPGRGCQYVPPPLKKLRLESLSNIMKYGDVFRWLDDSRTVRKLELVGIPAKVCGAAGSYLAHLAKSGCLLECFTFFPLIQKADDLGERCPEDLLHGDALTSVPVHIVHLHGIYRAIRFQKHLNTLHLRAEARHGEFLSWAPALLDNARDLPLAHVSLILIWARPGTVWRR